MNANTELERWRMQWQRQTEPMAPRDLAQTLKESVMRETRRLRITLIAPALVTLIIGGRSTLRALRDASPEGWLLLAVVWCFIVLTWIVALFLARGTWRPRADTTTAFIEVAIRRCESSLASVPFAIALYVTELAGFLGWKFHYLPGSASELLIAWPTVVLGWIGMPVFVILILRYRQRKRAELTGLLELRALLHAD